ncbi:MAG: hypothetical protein Q4D53_07710 [Leptotrichiaceae bacterium]|nr:hypothetical protein [Leptotrichiaceae bacterium]
MKNKFILIFLSITLFFILKINIFSQRIGEKEIGFITVNGIWKDLRIPGSFIVYGSATDKNTKIFFSIAFDRMTNTIIKGENIKEYVENIKTVSDRNSDIRTDIEKIIIEENFEFYKVTSVREKENQKSIHYLRVCQEGKRICSIFVSGKKKKVDRIEKMIEKSWNMEK